MQSALSFREFCADKGWNRVEPHLVKHSFFNNSVPTTLVLIKLIRSAKKKYQNKKKVQNVFFGLCVNLNEDELKELLTPDLE